MILTPDKYLGYDIILMTTESIGHGIDTGNLDTEVNPREDFYQYACGGWMKKHPLTPEFSQYGMFDHLRENAKLQLRELITNLSDHPDSKVKGTIAQKVADIYNLGMDSDRLNKEGASPLLPFIKKIEEHDLSDLESLIAWSHNGLSSVFFSTGIGPDAKDSNRNIMHIVEVGLGLGDRDYYLEKNETNDKIMAAYEIYVKKLMKLIGYDEEAQQRVWNNVIHLETEFARNKMTKEDRRDPLKRYNPTSYKQLKEDYPNFDWDKYFSALGVAQFEDLTLSNPEFLKFINNLLPTLTPQQIRDYIIFNIVSESTGVLSDDFQKASFELYGKVMSGAEEDRPRWKRAMTIPNAMLGEAVGQLYVEKYFPKENKEYMMTLVGNLQKALGKHIKALSWMSDETKQRALEKLDAFSVKIGYPDKWKDYSEISIEPEKSYLDNVYRASVWYTQDNYKKLNQPVDKSEWFMTPQTVNAYYSPVTNEICFPAGILQPPYFDLSADDAQNYGAIGVVIGHEMTHGFDDSGRKFDKDGNLKEWWTEEDANQFTQLADRLVEQFNKVEVAPGVFANGKYTLGENIADQGGLRLALTAYKDYVTDKETVDIDGFSPLQRFYLAYANVWAANIRDEEILMRTNTDPHSLGRNRVNVTLKNITPFHEAFGTKESDPMFLPEEERVIIW